MNISLSTFANDNLVSPDGFGRPASACSFSTLRLNLALTHGVPSAFRGGVHIFIPPYAFRPVPSLSGHAIVYRWRSLPRVRLQGPVVLKVVPVTGAAAYEGHHRPIGVRIHYWYEVVGILAFPSKHGFREFKS